MSKQPSERAFDVASEWHGHQLKCSIYHAPGRDDADCTCIVRDLALAIDAAIAAAREEAYEKVQEACESHLNRLRGMALLHRDRDLMVRTIDEIETALANENDDDDTWHDEWESHEFGAK